MNCTVDLMRYNAAAPKGVMDYLLIECMLWGKSLGYQWFNLGMAPLSGLEEHALAPAWHKIGRMVQALRRDVLSLRGLEKIQGEFLPVWRPPISRGAARLGDGRRAARRVTALISGGVGKVLRK